MIRRTKNTLRSLDSHTFLHFVHSEEEYYSRIFSGLEEEQIAIKCGKVYKSVTKMDRAINAESANRRNINDKYMCHVAHMYSFRILLPSLRLGCALVSLDAIFRGLSL